MNVSVDRPTTVWFAFVMLLAGGVFFARLGGLPIEVFDEARQAVNAQEMAHGGMSIVTTFDGESDHWNTKPPLAVWVMATSILLYGDHEAALRFPSALSGLLTVAMVFGFVRRVGGSLPAALAASLVLLATPRYVQFHAARSGEYDALLTLWTTGVVFSVYFGATTDDPRKRDFWYALACASLAAGFMTKTIQVFLIAPGLAAWIVLDRRLYWTLRSKAVWIGILVVTAVTVGWYALRDAIDPGYFQAALANDLIGRYSTAIEGHAGGPLKYLLDVKKFPWPIPATMAALLAWRYAGPQQRAALGLLLSTLVCYLGVISFSQTKLPWYSVPAVPLCAALVGISVSVLLPRVGALARSAAWGTVAVAIGVAVVIWNISFAALRDELLRKDVNRYSYFVRGPVANALPQLGSVLIVYPGFVLKNVPGAPWYPGPMQYYVNRMRYAGYDAVAVPREEAIGLLDGYDTVVTCSDTVSVLTRPAKRWIEVLRDGDCAAWAQTTAEAN